jgi:hypothetical protein
MAKRLSRTEQVYQRKLKDAVHLLFFTHHRLPGVRGWELRKELGADWQNIIEVLDKQLQPLDLKVTRVLEEPDTAEPTNAQLQDARYYIIMRGTVDQKTAKTIGWRIDDIAGLAVSVAYIISKQGKVPRQDVERILQEKLPIWARMIRASCILTGGQEPRLIQKSSLTSWSVLVRKRPNQRARSLF